MLLMTFSFFPKVKDIPKRPFSQCLSTIISPLFAEVRSPVDFWGDMAGEGGRDVSFCDTLPGASERLEEAATSRRGVLTVAPPGTCHWDVTPGALGQPKSLCDQGDFQPQSSCLLQNLLGCSLMALAQTRVAM